KRDWSSDVCSSDLLKTVSVSVRVRLGAQRRLCNTPAVVRVQVGRTTARRDIQLSSVYVDGTPITDYMNYCVVMPGPRHTLMDLDVRTKDIRFLSTAQVEGQLPDKSRGGFTVSGGAAAP